MDEFTESSTDGKYRVRVEIMQDSRDFNPRVSQKDCNLANVITPAGQRYADVDSNGGPLQGDWDRVAERGDAVGVFTRWARTFHGITVVEDRPAGGVRSLWYVMPRNLKKTTWTAREVIGAESREYRQWADGEVYRWIVEKAKAWTDSGGKRMTTWEREDSCGGYIGLDRAEEAAREALSEHSGEDVTE